MSGTITEGGAERPPHTPRPTSAVRPGALSPADREAFWAKVGPPDDNGCRPWLGALNREGRGRHTVRGVTRYAYAYSLLIDGTDVPPGVPVRHLCGNPSCCEPTHLSIEGGQSANNADTVRHGRHRSAKLTPADAREIRRRLASGDPPSQAALADDYGVSPSAISAVALGKTFDYAGGPLKNR